jgi:hypothetical protein
METQSVAPSRAAPETQTVALSRAVTATQTAALSQVVAETQTVALSQAQVAVWAAAQPPATPPWCQTATLLRTAADVRANSPIPTQRGNGQSRY